MYGLVNGVWVFKTALLVGGIENEKDNLYPSDSL